MPPYSLFSLFQVLPVSHSITNITGKNDVDQLISNFSGIRFDRPNAIMRVIVLEAINLKKILNRTDITFSK